MCTHTIGLGVCTRVLCTDVCSTHVPDVCSTHVPDVCSTHVPDVCSTHVPDVCSTHVPDVCSTHVPDVCSTHVPDVCSTHVPDVCSTHVPDVCSTHVVVEILRHTYARSIWISFIFGQITHVTIFHQLLFNCTTFHPLGLLQVHTTKNSF